jgi:hypothetical protein
MPTFRNKVLDALDIVKKSTKLNVRETFPTAVEPNTGVRLPFPIIVNYALSETINSTVIGPSNGTILVPAVGLPTITSADGTTTETNPDYIPPVFSDKAINTLDVLGFVIGEEPEEFENRSSLPLCMERSSATSTPDAQSPQAGFHFLNGLYDPQQDTLNDMRKSAYPKVGTYDTTMYDTSVASVLVAHEHKDWPTTVYDQCEKFRLDPYADSLFYGSTRLTMLLTGILIPKQDTASNHRGLVRMLICRPKMPTARMRITNGSYPDINMNYPPNFETDLFYTKKKTLGGRMNPNMQIRNNDTQGRFTDHVATFGLKNYSDHNKELNVDVDDIHYGHYIPNDGVAHALTPFDVITSPINTNKYSVIRDETFYLDTQHHGVASQRSVNVNIPYNMKVRFAGRKPQFNQVTVDGETISTQSLSLSNVTIDEPLNMPSRPFIMFLSMDQKISAQVTGYTNVYET